MKFIKNILLYIELFFTTRYYAARLHPKRALITGLLDLGLVIWLVYMNLNLGLFLVLVTVPLIGLLMATAAIIHHLNKPIEEYEYEICEECDEDDDKGICTHKKYMS